MIWALHGFLGRGADFAFLADPFREQGFELQTVDLFSSIRPRVRGTMEEWGESFAREISAADHDPVILGYSLGGRLALHTLLAAPSQFRGAVLVSAGLGIEDESERLARRHSDDGWAKRFDSEPWEPLIRDWNAQPIFSRSAASPGRAERDYDRRALADALRWWSPAVHEPLLPRLGEISRPVLWVAGAQDARYADVARTACRELPNAELWVCPEASHRVPWEQPARFAERVTEFLIRNVSTARR